MVSKPSTSSHKQMYSAKSSSWKSKLNSITGMKKIKSLEKVTQKRNLKN